MAVGVVRRRESIQEFLEFSRVSREHVGPIELEN